MLKYAPLYKPQHSTTANHTKSAKGLKLKDNRRPVQAKLTTSGFKTLSGSLPPNPNKIQVTGTQPLTGSPISTSVFVTKEKSQTSPANLKGMSTWSQYIKDPSRSNSQNLTRMHAINGTFYGPSKPDNMFLGTAASNNSNSMSHLHQVENPIRNFLKDKNALGVHYTVTPNYGHLPAYMSSRIAGISNTTTRANFKSWAEEGIPNQYSCAATFYRKNPVSGKNESIPQQVETLDAALGAPTAVSSVAGTVAAVAGGLGGMVLAPVAMTAAAAALPALLPIAAASGIVAAAGGVLGAVALPAVGSILSGSKGVSPAYAATNSLVGAVNIGGHALRSNRAQPGDYKKML